MADDMKSVDLGSYDNSWFHPGRSHFIRAVWFFFGLPVLRSGLVPSSAVRVWLLRKFGAEIGKGVVIKPGVRVKFPWRLTVGDNCWLGEDCWIDNLAQVQVESNVCISQGAYLCTGNHDWSDPGFGLRTQPIAVRRGCWVGARAILLPGVELGECAVATAGSVVTKSIPAFSIFGGNPAVFLKHRRIGREDGTPELAMKARA